MFLFILESIGMPELLLIGAVALMVFGPRKLPEMAKMIGKTMAEFRRATGEFKETWEKEAKFDLDDLDDGKLNTIENTRKISGSEKVIIKPESSKFIPEIREINADDFDMEIIADKIPIKTAKVESEKRNWL